jgi:hypothetical protein
MMIGVHPSMGQVGAGKAPTPRELTLEERTAPL